MNNIVLHQTGTFYAVGGRNNSPESSYDSDWVDR